MAIQDLAQRSGFTHAVESVVLLQLELPSTQSELRELFSCQLELDDIPNAPLEQNEWRNSDLAKRLKPGEERGTIGTVTVFRMDQRDVTFDPDHRDRRLLTLFGCTTQLGQFRQDNITRYGYSLNVRIRCLSIERDNGRIWRVRGEILSGGLIFGDQRAIPDADRQRVWPNENLRGIFFTGSELQIEVGPTVALRHPTASQPISLPDTQPTDLNRVKIGFPPTGAIRPLMFRAGPNKTALASAEWHTIETWQNGIVTLNDPYGSTETKPKTQWQYQIIERDNLPRRFRLLGVNRREETGVVQQAVWEQISASAALSQLLNEPAGLPIEPPANTVDRHFKSIEAIGSSLGITLKKQEQTASRSIVVVDGMDSLDPFKFQRREFLRVDWNFGFDQRIGNVVWTPQTLLVHSTTANNARYELIDHDAVEAELRGESAPGFADAKVKFNWNRRDDVIQPTIPETRLIGTALDADRRPTQETPERSRELWFQASCASGTPYAGSPLAWANVSAQQPPAVPVGDGARAVRLSGPIVYSTSDWTLEATPADPESGRATVTPGVRLTLSQTDTNKEAKLELFAADVTLDSPRFRIYSKTLNDPKSVPNERLPQEDTVETSLRFIHRPEWERVPPGDEQASVVCSHQRDTGSDKFVMSRSPHAVRLYLPAERALIDPVSVTRGNLVGRQIVAFPLLIIPDPQSTGVTLTVTDVRIVTANDKSLTAQVDLQLEGAGNADDVFGKLTDHEGFYAQFGSSTDEFAPASVVRIRDLTSSSRGDTRTLVSPILAGQLLPFKNNQYRMTVGPTRLALPRDVNHGLIPIGVSEFQINPPQDGFASLNFAANKIRGEEGQSVLALHPWSEWGPRPEALTDPKRPWLTTGRVRLHHRNLIQEHAEFESSFEDRFPPEGPAKDPDGSIPSPLLPLADFTRAVRDRYTETTGNVIAPAAGLHERAVRNWLPNSKLIDNASRELHPRVAMELNANDLTVLPEAKVRTELDIEEDPFSYKAKDGGIERDFYQSLKLRKATEPGADQHWLDVSVRPEGMVVGSAPTIRLAKTDPADVTSRRAVDSSVPLLFSRHDICALATIGLDGGGCIAIVGSPEQSAASYLFAADGSISQSHTLPGNALVDVTLLRHGGAIRGLAIRKAGNGVELIRFTIDSTSGSPTVDPTALTVAGTPMALACTSLDSSASIYVLTSQPDKVFVVPANSGPSKEIVGAGANATAINADFIENVRYLAIGTREGTVSIWRETVDVWSKIAEGEKRLVTSPLLGGGINADLEISEAGSIRGLCVRGDTSQLCVVAVDGTRFPCVWGIDKPFPTLPTKAEARVWLQQSVANSVSFGRVQDLEQRPRFNITDNVITKLSQAGVPADAIHSLQPIKNKEFPNRIEFEHRLRELLDAGHEVHLQTIVDHARIDSTAPLFTVGLRSGSVRVCAAIGRSEGLTDIRQFDTSETPVTRLSLAGGSDVDKPAVWFAGTSAGGLLAWDARRGMEWPEAPTQPTATIPQPVTPTTYLDALGVVRAMPTFQAADGLTVDDLSLGTDSYRSLTTRGLNLVVEDAGGTSADDLTDIRLWADSFKVLADGTVEPRQFSDGPFDPGHIAFFSSITAPDDMVSMAALNHVPRLGGVPFFVTGVKRLKLNTDRTAIANAVLEGVLINPDEVGAGQDPADADTLPGIVVRALSRCKPIEVTLESGSWNVTSGSLIDWAFAVNRQVPEDEPSEEDEPSKNFPGAVARIVGTVTKSTDGQLSIVVHESRSRALVFGRLWPFSESVTIVSHASFERSGTHDPWLQTQFSFASAPGSSTPFLSITSEKQESPKAELGVNFGNIQIGGAALSGSLETSRRVQFKLGTQEAVAQFEQGGYRCLTLQSTTTDKTRGQAALLLWTAGDLTGVGFDQAVGALRLCAAYVKITVESDATAQTGWTLTAGTSQNQVSGNCSAKVHRSLVTVDANDSGTSETVAQLGTVLIEATLRGQELWLLLEGNVQSASTEMTGQLVLKAGTTVALQATVRATLNLEAKTIELFDDVFWAALITPASAFFEPEIRMPTVLGTMSPAFSVNGYTFERVPPRGFVRIGLKKVSNELVMGTRSVDPSQLPLLPELEPSLVQAPERIGNNDVRLSHRNRAGLALRPNAPSGRFGIALNATTAGETSLPSLPTGQALLLDTVVSTAGPLLRLRPEGWLVPTTTTDTYRTDGLFVLNVDFRRGDMPVVAAVEARTRKFDPDESSPNERKRYRELLRATGDQGVAITYRLTDGHVADLGFVDSPFYDHVGEVESALRFVASVAPAGLAQLAAAEAVAVSEPAWIYGFDPRFRLPSTLAERLAQPTTGRYVVADLPADPYADVCCLAHRQYRLERRRLTDHVEEFDPSATPILHNAEVPAFRQPARLSSLLPGRWMRTEPADAKPSIPRVFFPPRVDWELAADKPGAMFQSLVQARVTTKERATSREPLIDFALREPQFVRLAECVNAEVYWQTGAGETTVSEPVNGYANVNLVWTEVVGSVQVEDESATAEWLKPTATGIALSRTPLQLVIDFNSEVFLVNQADAAVPAYRVEAQPDGGVPSAKVRPAATYLVANPDVETVFAPQTVANDGDDCTLTSGSDGWKVTVSGVTIQSGTSFTLTDFSSAELNSVAHRFVGASGGATFTLMQDTAPEDSVPNSFSMKVEGNDYTATIRCRRPLCVDVTGLDGAPKNDLNGKSAISTELSGKLRQLRDGADATELRLAQVVPNDKQYLIVTPSQLPSAGSGKSRIVTTQADGFLEAAVRMPAEVAAEPAKAWTPALTLTAPALDDLKPVGEHKLIRLDCKNPAANGVFGVLGNDKLLARPLAGNGRSNSGGKARILGGSSVDLANVEGVTPIILTLATDPGWNEGTTAVVVSDVRDVPQANGSWVVQKLSDDESGRKRFALFEPTVAELQTSTPIPAVASAVIPLREAFPPSADLGPRLRRLNLEPKWKVEDRPLLQIHWVGSAQFPNEDGKGIAWRQGGVMVGLYEQVKQVKFLANSQLSPKLAFVMTAPAGTSWQRTILFGDSAPPFKAEPNIDTVEADGITTTHFFLKIPNNRESLSVPVPEGVTGKFALHVVKSMPSGVAIYDEHSVGTS